MTILLGAWLVELFMYPPSLVSNTSALGKNRVHGPLNCLDTRLRVNLLKQLANDRRVRFDEAQKPVGILFVIAAADPYLESVVLYRNNPSPIFANQLLLLE